MFMVFKKEFRYFTTSQYFLDKKFMYRSYCNVINDPFK